MSESKKNDQAPEVENNEKLETESVEEVTETLESEETSEKVKVEFEIEKLKNENAELQDKYLRLFAEFDNYRKRSSADIQAAKGKGIDAALHSFFPCMDSIDRAMAMCKDEVQLSGFKLVLKQFENALYTLGVTAIDPIDEEFDPEYHNAVLKEVDPERAGKVIQVLQKGYKYKDTLLRPAMVKIASEEE